MTGSDLQLPVAGGRSIFGVPAAGFHGWAAERTESSTEVLSWRRVTCSLEVQEVQGSVGLLGTQTVTRFWFSGRSTW